MTINRLGACLILAVGLLAAGSPGLSQTRDAEARDAAAETVARPALENFITQWNTADDANLRRTMHFPFATAPGGGALLVAPRPEDFSAGFDEMRTREGWSRSSFDFHSLAVVRSSPDKAHAEIGFSRYRTDGTAYRTSRVFYHAEQGALRADVHPLAPRRHPLLDGPRALDRDPRGRPLGHPGPLAHAGHVRRAPALTR